MGLRLLKVNFPWLGLVGLVQGVTLPMNGSLLAAGAVDIIASVTLLGPGLMGLSLSEVGEDTRPWMVLETRAEIVTRLRSGETEQLCGLAGVVGLSDKRELVAVRGGFVPFIGTPGGALMEPVGVSAPFTVTLGDMGAEGEEGLGVPDTDDLEAPGWTGGSGARYLTLAGCD